MGFKPVLSSGKNTLKRLSLLLWTVRFLTPCQVWYRGRRVLRRRWWRRSGKQAPQPDQWQLATFNPLYAGLGQLSQQTLWQAQVTAAVQRAVDVAQGRFCFLNHPVEFGDQPNWHDPSVSQLWRYHLHYFAYVQDLLIWAATPHAPEAYQAFRTLVNAWIDGNQALAGDGWHPYTLSLRLVNWLHAVSGFQTQLDRDPAFRQRLLSSLYGQAQILASDLELDVRGNHLWENIRALLWVGVAFTGAEPQRWLQRAFSLLQRETAEQILADGGHFERTPGYHLVVLKDSLEMALWLRHNQRTIPAALDAAVRRMLDYLVAVLPPDGQMPLLKDTAWDAAPHAEDLLAAGALYCDEPMYKRSPLFGLYPGLLFGLTGWQRWQAWPLNAAPSPSQALPNSGYFVLRSQSGDAYLIFDVGKPCPDYLPAHAHADLLSYELHIDRQRVIVDSGVYAYEAGAWRQYFRSTRAHNTVEVAGQDQSEVWGSFRVARRAQPQAAFWQPTDTYVLGQAQHDGYRRLVQTVSHRRTIVWRKNRFWLIVDELWGQGRITAQNLVHLHPDFTLEGAGASTWRIQGGAAPLWLVASGQQGDAIICGQVEPLRQGWYSEEFNLLRRNHVLMLYQDHALPFCFAYVIAKHSPPHIVRLPTEEGYRFRVLQDGIRYDLILPQADPPRFEEGPG